MKKIIFISGILCANVMMAGCLFKIFHWPGASVLLTLAVALFSLVFLPSALISNYHSQEVKKQEPLYIVTFVVFSIGMMSILFKVQHWPGANILLLFAIPSPFVLFLPVYLYQTRNKKREDNMNFLAVMFGLTFLAVFSVLLATNIA